MLEIDMAEGGRVEQNICICRHEFRISESVEVAIGYGQMHG